MNKLPAVLLSLALAGTAGAQMAHGGGPIGGGAAHEGGFGGHSFGSSASRPGQFVTSPGQTVFTPGQPAFGPGQFGPGQMISPAPNVLTPFNNGLRGSYAGGWNQGYQGFGHRDYDHDHDHGYGYGDGAPFLFGGGYWMSPYDLGYPDFSGDTGGSYNQQPQSAAVQGEPAGYRQSYPDPQGSMGPSSYRPDYNAKPADAPNVVQQQEPSLTVVMKDGSKKQIRNFALTKTTLIDLDQASTGHLKSIPLEQVNVPATESAAQDAGLSFSVPTS
jgi:hypothetical protein